MESNPKNQLHPTHGDAAPAGNVSQSYEASRQAVRALYVSRISGSATGLFVVVHSSPLSDAAMNALTKTAESLRYGPDPVTYVNVGKDGGADSQLDDRSLFNLIEGLDPICMVTCDDESASRIAEAYRAQIVPMTPCRVFGRSVAPLDRIDDLLSTQQGKACMWGVLRTLPRFHEE